MKLTFISVEAENCDITEGFMEKLIELARGSGATVSAPTGQTNPADPPGAPDADGTPAATVTANAGTGWCRIYKEPDSATGTVTPNYDNVAVVDKSREEPDSQEAAIRMVNAAIVSAVTNTALHRPEFVDAAQVRGYPAREYPAATTVRDFVDTETPKADSNREACRRAVRAGRITTTSIWRFCRESRPAITSDMVGVIMCQLSKGGEVERDANGNWTKGPNFK